ncbi:unnamed protein product [Tilletia controversa]|nr:unnamed protein product [Tilletia controversa]
MSRAPPTPASAAAAPNTTNGPLVFYGNMPQHYRSSPSSTNNSSSRNSGASTPTSPIPGSPDPGAYTPATTALRGQFIVQSEVPPSSSSLAAATPPSQDVLVRLKREEQKRLDELDAQLKRVFANPSAGAATQSAMSRVAASAGSAAGSAVVQYALGSTLLPQGIADLISNISLLARISLKCSAFFIEVLIEAARFSTGAGLGITRRALISAVASARNVSSMAGNMLPNALLEGAQSSTRNGNDQDAMKALSKTSGPANHAFLTVLDRYTSLGIYLIHHTFTLAELFVMSGFNLTTTGIKIGIGAADESVHMLDQIFGSNETSRALSSFITLARREITDDPITASTGLTGTVKTIAYLTKAITAFAVLQNMTYRRSFKQQNLKVIYDCTVLGEAETNSWRAKFLGPGNFVPARKTSLMVGSATGGPHHVFSLLAPGRHGGPLSTSGDSSTTVLAHPQRRPRPTSYLSSRSSLARPLSGEQSCITDFDPSTLDGHAAETSTEDDIMADLDFYVGEGDDEEDGDDTFMASADSSSDKASMRKGPKGTRDRSRAVVSAKRVRPTELTEEMRMVLKTYGDRELEHGVIISQETEPRGRREVRRTMRKTAGEKEGEVVFEMITEIVETTETTTTVEARTPTEEKELDKLGMTSSGKQTSQGSNGKWALNFGRQKTAGSSSKDGGMSESTSSKTARQQPFNPTGATSPRKTSLNNWIPSVFQPLKAGEKRTERDVTNTRSAVDTESIFEDRVEQTRMEEDTWCEISTSSQAARERKRQQLKPDQFIGALQRLSSVEGLGPVAKAASCSEDEVERELVLGDGESGVIPTSPNGAPATAVGIVALRDSLEHPDQSKARMQVVLKTMTKKLVQRKRILKKITVKSRADGSHILVPDEGDDGEGYDDDDLTVGMLLEGEGETLDGPGSPGSPAGLVDDHENNGGSPSAAGFGLHFTGAKGKERLRERVGHDSSAASSDGARTPRRGSVPVPDSPRKASSGGSTLQRAFGRARDVVRNTSRSSSAATVTQTQPSSGRNAGSSDISMRSVSTQGREPELVISGPPSPTAPTRATSSSKSTPSPAQARMLLSPAPAVPTRARNNISATALPTNGHTGASASGATSFESEEIMSPNGSVTQRGSKRKSKRTSRSTFGVPFLGAQYDPSVETSAGGGNGTNGLLHSPPMISSRRHSRAQSVTSVHSFTSRTHTHTNTTAHNSPYLSSAENMDARHESRGGGGVPPSATVSPDLGPNFPGEPAGAEGNAYFPHSHLVKNLHRFMRHSSAAYGQNFMRIFGIGQADYFFPDTSKHHANVWSFAHHVGLDVDKILLSSFTEGGTGPFHSDKMSPLVNYVSVDDDSQAIVFTCRGTLGLSDILTDLTCSYESITVQGGHPEGQYKVHAGMLHSARLFRAQSSTVFSTIRLGLEENPDYGVVLAGHSLGGGVCTILAVLWGVPAPVFLRQIEDIKAKGLEPPAFPPITTPFVTSLTSGLPPGRPIHAYAYGPPATASADLSRFCRGLVTSLAHGYDMVPFLSLGSLRDLKNVAKSLAEERESDVAQEIVARTIGLLQHKRQKVAGRSSEQAQLPPSPATGISASDLEHFNQDSMSQAQPIVEERIQTIDIDDLTRGRTSNRASKPGYRDPNFARQQVDEGEMGTVAHSIQDDVETDAELNQWLWAVIKTMRADMKEEKLFPPGHVYCIESFAVFVTPRMSRSSMHSRQQDYDRLAASKGQAHRVVLRYCDDVENRFSELVWSMSMMRDHIPTNYEFCTQLLFESVLPDDADAPGNT